MCLLQLWFLWGPSPWREDGRPLADAARLSLCTHVPYVAFHVLTSSYGDSHAAGSGPPYDLLYLNHLHKDPVSKYMHILRCWGSGPQHRTLGATTHQQPPLRPTLTVGLLPLCHSVLSSRFALQVSPLGFPRYCFPFIQVFSRPDNSALFKAGRKRGCGLFPKAPTNLLLWLRAKLRVHGCGWPLCRGSWPALGTMVSMRQDVLVSSWPWSPRSSQLRP